MAASAPSPSIRFSRLSLASLVICALVALPMVFVLASLFGPADSGWTHLRETVLADYVRNTLTLMILVGLIATSLGVSTAWLVAATEFPGRKLLSWALVLPLAAPPYVIAYVYTDLLEFSGPVQSLLRDAFNWSAGDYWFPSIRSLPGAALMLSFVLYPYIYLLARAAFTRRSATLFEAARTLGQSPLRAFYRAALPAARPAIIGGLMLVLMETIADYGVVDYFGVQTFSTGIFRTWFALGEKAAAVKLTAWMFLFVIVLIALEKASRRGMTSSALSKDGASHLMPLKGLSAIGATLLCALPVVIGCILPMLVLGRYALTVGDPLIGTRFMGFIGNSFLVATTAALVTTLAALVISYAQRLSPSALSNGTAQFATLGYALPGTMLAIGLLGPLTAVDKSLAGVMQEIFGISTGLLLTGSIFALVYVYMIRFITVAYNACQSGFETIHPSMDAAARVLGAKPGSLLSKVHLPLMRNSLLAAVLLVFVDVMRELPATLLMRPFNFDTLATRVYNLASDERLAEASTAAITIVLIGLVPTILLSVLTNRQR
jgi:iron(III) transport system permease protein